MVILVITNIRLESERDKNIQREEMGEKGLREVKIEGV